MLVAGIDSSTQSTKVLLCRAEDGAIVAQASAPHPDGTECHPDHWWHALTEAGKDLLEQASAVGVAAQQHGMIALDESGAVVRPAMLWNDVKSAPQAEKLIAELGGPAEWAARTGSVPSMSFTVTKLRWLAEREPGNAERTHRVLLPHDWLTWRLAGGGASSGGASSSGASSGGAGSQVAPVTDRGDASGTGYYSPADGRWLPDLAQRAIGHQVDLPRVAGPSEAVGRTDWGAVLSAGTGDNMGAALGLGLREGDMAVSIGTSGTAYLVSPTPSADPSGAVAGFADATGRFLPLVATVNAARVLDVTARMLGAVAAGPGRRPGGRRTGVSPLPGRRAHSQPADRQRRAARPHNAQHDPREPCPGSRGGRAVLAGRRHRLRRGRHRGDATADRPHRRRGALGGDPPGRPGDLRRPGQRARARPGRGAGRGPAGGMGARGHGDDARVARPAGPDVRGDRTAPRPGAVRRPSRRRGELAVTTIVSRLSKSLTYRNMP